MSNHCSHCGATSIESEAPCPRCGTRRLVRGGWLAHFLDLLLRVFRRRHGSAVIASQNERPHKPGAELWLDDASAGASLKWESTDGRLPDDLPEDMRTRLQALRRSAAERGEGFEVRTAKQEMYVFTDGSGRQRRYRSVEEMPPEVRQAFERMKHPDREPRDSHSQWPL